MTSHPVVECLECNATGDRAEEDPIEEFLSPGSWLGGRLSATLSDWEEPGDGCMRHRHSSHAATHLYHQQLHQRHSGLQLFGATSHHFGRRSTLHGLNHVANAKTCCRRLFWLLISSLATVGLVLNVHEIVVKFLKVPILTNTEHDVEVFEFPDITFCNLNAVYFPPEDTDNFRQINQRLRDYIIFKPKLNVEMADYLYILGEEYSHPSWSFILSCSYQEQPCNWTHFEPRPLWPYGLCYTFSPEKMNAPRKAQFSLMEQGDRPFLNVIFYKAVEQPISRGPSESFQDSNMDMPTGVMVMFHERDTYPIITESFLLDGCAIADLKITWKYHLRELNKCQREMSRKTYYFPMIQRNVTLATTWATCVNVQLQYTVFSHCGCLWHLFPVPAELFRAPFCYHPTRGKVKNKLIACMNESYVAMLNNTAQVDLCHVDLCEHPTYSTVMAQPNFPAIREKHTQMEWLKALSELEAREMAHFNQHSTLWKHALLKPPDKRDMFNNNQSTGAGRIKEVFNAGKIDLLNIDFVERNFMMFRLVPASMFVDVVRETAEYTLSRLLSDIGGLIGLWIGASLITVFEFVDLLLDVCDSLTMLHRAKYRQKKFWAKISQERDAMKQENENKALVEDASARETGPRGSLWRVSLPESPSSPGLPFGVDLMDDLSAMDSIDSSLYFDGSAAPNTDANTMPLLKVTFDDSNHLQESTQPSSSAKMLHNLANPFPNMSIDIVAVV